MKISSRKSRIILMTLFISCKSQRNQEIKTEEATKYEEVIIPLNLQWSERMVLSVMEENPEPWKKSFGDRKYWNYTDGLVLTGINELIKLPEILSMAIL